MPKGLERVHGDNFHADGVLLPVHLEDVMDVLKIAMIINTLTGLANRITENRLVPGSVVQYSI